ncbi:MAG: hypothetical protein NVSMB22_13320 [Chloroflexota bacterium]
MPTHPSVNVLVDVDTVVTSNVDAALLRDAALEAFRLGNADTARAPLKRIDMHRPLELGIRITNDAEMRRLNRQYRNVDRSTDVLSFSFVEDDASMQLAPEGPIYVGDIALSFETVQKQALELGHSVSTELAWLTVHGTLQILGYTHETDETAKHMESLEHSALKSLRLFPD